MRSPKNALVACATVLLLGISLFMGCDSKKPVSASGQPIGTGPRTSVPKPLPSNLESSLVVDVVPLGDGFQLTRGGKPYQIKGAGGEGSLEMLASVGANSNRLWGVDDDTQARLDEAHAQGLTVALGIWIEHPSDKFSYNSYENVSQQVDLVIDAVRKYKDHPAVLVWGIGNEMEVSGGGQGDNPAIWQHVGYLASLVKKEDPHHPTMTVIAEVGGRKVKAINKFCPDIDIVGINSYGGARTVGERYRQTGGTKPFIVTEFGPIGTWEVNKNDIGAILEPTSTEKVKFYRDAYESFTNDSMCLGSYAFLWGHKQEGTETWFGMLTPDGKKTAAVDLMQELWTGNKPDNPCPEVKPLEINGDKNVDPGAEVRVQLVASDSDGSPLNVSWKLMQEADSYVTGGFKQETPPTFEDSLVKGSIDSAVFKLPEQSGLYRIYATVDDGAGAAIANIPVRVKSPEAEVDLSEVKKGKLPYALYEEPVDIADFVPSGFMGTASALTVEQASKDKPHSGDHCLECSYSIPGNWGGVVWQSPENDWGDKPGGLNLEGAKRFSFWARGDKGAEVIKFGVGLIGREKPFFDTVKKEIEVTLTSEWKQYEIDLSDSDCRRIKSGFYFSLAGQGKALKFFLDDLKYEE